MRKKEKDKQNIIIGQQLKTARKNAGITQAELADILGIYKTHISEIERGIVNPSLSLFIGYCRALNTSPNDILEWDSIDPEYRKLLSSMSKDEQDRLIEIYNLMKPTSID